MRIVQLIQKPQRRGAELFAADFAGWLRADGHTVAVVSLYAHPGSTRLPQHADDLALDADEHSRSERALNAPLVARLAWFLRRFAPDVVQANGGRTLKYAAAVRALGAPRALWVYRNIDSPRFWLKRRLPRLVLPRLVRATFDAAVGVSRTTLREVNDIYGFVGSSIAIENGVDYARLSPSASSTAAADVATGEVKLVWAGAFGPQKRPDVAIELLARLGKRYVLTMLGEGPWLEQTQRLAAERGVGERVRFLGNRRDIGDVMRASDIFIMTSDTDGIPAVVLEAQHCGLPVVSFDVGGLKECIDAGNTGVLVAHGDLTGFVEAIASTTARLGPPTSTACRQYAERFSINQIGPRYLRFFAERIGDAG
jgi:glycosyltransferase involved in cell wall biosynthesis